MPLLFATVRYAGLSLRICHYWGRCSWALLLFLKVRRPMQIVKTMRYGELTRIGFNSLTLCFFYQWCSSEAVSATYSKWRKLPILETSSEHCLQHVEWFQVSVCGRGTRKRTSFWVRLFLYKPLAPFKTESTLIRGAAPMFIGNFQTWTNGPYHFAGPFWPLGNIMPTQGTFLTRQNERQVSFSFFFLLFSFLARM